MKAEGGIGNNYGSQKSMGMTAGITFDHWNGDLVSHNLRICITDHKPFVSTIIMETSSGMASRERTGNSIFQDAICIGTIDFIIVIYFCHTKTLA